MISGFWKKLNKPIYALAPMANVTDCAFRSIIAKYGKPDVMFTEFVACDGLQSAGRDKLLIDLKFSKAERPMVAQIFGSKPDNFYKTALLLQELGIDGIDINMGCPDRNVEKQGAGAKLMQDPKLAQEIIKETIRGAGKLPISVKTRVGFNKVELDTWLPSLLECDIAAITVHARTRKEMSKVPARWAHIAEAVKLRDKYNPKTLVLGNGDVLTIAEANLKIAETNCDGVMIGRGIFGNPWLFRQCHSESPFAGGEESLSQRQNGQRSLVGRPPASLREALRAGEASLGMTNYIPTLKEKLMVMVEHTKLFEKYLIDYKSFDIMKKHYKAYVNGFDGAKELRIKLMTTKTAADVERIVAAYLSG